MDTVEDTRAVEELVEVYRRRYQEARRCGLSVVEAALFADSEADVGQLRRLHNLGCPVQLLRRIVL